MTVLNHSELPNYNPLPDDELIRLWGEAGRNLSRNRLIALLNSEAPEGPAEEAYVQLRDGMIERNLPIG